MKQNTVPLNLQFFASSATGNDEPGKNEPGDNQQNTQQQNTQQQGFEIDYDKIASIVSGKQTVAEETVLKNYFKQQGLSQEEATQAMQKFKEQKAKNTPDVAGIQTQLVQAQEQAKREAVEKAAILEAVGLGLDSKTIPYILKLAELTEVTEQDGKVNQETLRNAINKVLDDIPQLKPTQENQRGFQIGGGGNQQKQESQSDRLAGIFGNKK